MQPLISNNTFNRNRNKLHKFYNGKSLCIISTIVLLTIIIGIGYFSSGSSKQLNNNNPARSFFEVPDNSGAYPSSISWKNPGAKGLGLPPKPKVPADGEQADGSAAATGTGLPIHPPGWEAGPGQESNPWDNPMNANPQDFGSDDWKTPGWDLGGSQWGGDDAALIDRGDDFQAPTEGEVPIGGLPDEPADEAKEEEAVEKESASSSSKKVTHPDPNYPTTVNVDKNRLIVPSDPNKASSYYKANGEEDLVPQMPYLVQDTCSSSKTQCAFKQYSGYLLGNNNAEIHYWFIEAEEDADNKPIFVWTNGGPGCSGMDGLLTEHGPWKVTDNLKIVYNKHAWNTEVNMIYLEQPFGVGFSVNEKGSRVVSGDQNSADDMDAAIRNFITKFPKYKDNKIFLSSESWGGHYVPITTYTILQNNDNREDKINLGGFFLGNPYTDFYENSMGFVGDIYGHGLMKSKDWDTWRDVCWGNEEAIDNDPDCSAIYSRAYISAYNANVYALDWPQCSDDMDWDMDLLNRPAPSFWMKDAHIHHAARLFMEKLLANHDFKALKMGLQKSELQQLHDRIAKRLSEEEVEEEDAYYGYYGATGTYQPPQQPQQGAAPYQPPQTGSQLPGQSKPEDGSGYNGMPTGGNAPVQGMPPQQGQPGMPAGGAAPVGNAPVQGMPQQPVAGYPGQSSQTGSTGYDGTQQLPTRKVPKGGQHGRPNHNLGNKVPDFAKPGYGEEQQEEELSDEDETAETSSGYDMTEDYLPCIEYDMQDYLNLATVQEALHVKPTEWQMCSDVVWNAWPESDYDTKIQAFYAEIIDNYLKKQNLKLAVYSGDDDSVCGLQGTQYWLDRWSGFEANPDQQWQAWEDSNNELGGYYTQYRSSSDQRLALHFITVRSAGHMVPTTQPKRAIALLKKYLYEFTVSDD
mmetsp:Transcript_71835/g.64539  ORF Transcript_71835/g.64539 Transcript_71835/m.64539 type:complete len:913 (+) Transcript_71835:64-2802(+)